MMMKMDIDDIGITMKVLMKMKSLRLWLWLLHLLLLRCEPGRTVSVTTSPLAQPTSLSPTSCARRRRRKNFSKNSFIRRSVIVFIFIILFLFISMCMSISIIIFISIFIYISISIIIFSLVVQFVGGEELELIRSVLKIFKESALG